MYFLQSRQRLGEYLKTLWFTRATHLLSYFFVILSYQNSWFCLYLHGLYLFVVRDTLLLYRDINPMKQKDNVHKDLIDGASQIDKEGLVANFLRGIKEVACTKIRFLGVLCGDS